ncbi:MAG: AIR synthase family protein [Planctomycetes bacterium]|nr:AIR synthase family protein [Planctomycetota bacterium]
MQLPTGKLDAELLGALIARNKIKDDRVIIRPGIGRDVCAIRMGSTCLVAKTDPITFATDRIGWYVVQVNANDIATVGARPRWFLVTVLLPEGRTDLALVESIWDELREALDGIDCELCGGHTEITAGLERPILVGQMLGEVEEQRLIRKENIRPGDRVLLTKGVPVEGTAIMAREMGAELEGEFPAPLVARGRAFLDDPGISIVREALAACEAGEVHAMHDPTEGGLATALWELAEAAGCGLRVQKEQIPILEPGGTFCRHFGLDPLGTIASGALLICAPPQAAPGISAAIRQFGLKCVDVGEVLPAEEGVTLQQGGGVLPMPRFDQDEITRLFDSS